MSKFLKIAAVGFVCAASMASCYELVLPPDIKLNSNPVEKYKVVLNIKNPPGPVRVTGVANYGMRNRGNCTPIDSRRSLGGSHPVFRKTIALPVRQVSENTYEMIFYKDALKNENYYGKGVCEWTGGAAFRVHWSGASYSIGSHGGVGLGEAANVVCLTKPSGELGICRDEEYSRKATPETHFYSSVVIYKE